MRLVSETECMLKAYKKVRDGDQHRKLLKTRFPEAVVVLGRLLVFEECGRDSKYGLSEEETERIEKIVNRYKTLLRDDLEACVTIKRDSSCALEADV